MLHRLEPQEIKDYINRFRDLLPKARKVIPTGLNEDDAAKFEAVVEDDLDAAVVMLLTELASTSFDFKEEFEEFEQDVTEMYEALQ